MIVSDVGAEQSSSALYCVMLVVGVIPTFTQPDLNKDAALREL